MQQSLRGDLIRLRPLEDDDLDAVLRLYQSTSNYFAPIGYGHDPVSKLQLQREWSEAQQPHRMMYAIERCEDDMLIGMADVDVQATMSDTATIRLLLIGGPYQRRGYGKEAADLLEPSMFALPEIEFVMAGVAESSQLGQRFWQRRGYQYSATTHDPVTSRTTIWLAKKRPLAAGEPA